ncbi:MAG: S-methyl-5-thioribose-1-phosphate isomerase, partial [Planctomycetota bacterium]
MSVAQPVREFPATMTWLGDASGTLRLIDQTLLPVEYLENELKEVAQVFEAIRSLRVRGAPAIGCAAAYGLVIGLQPFVTLPRAEFDAKVTEVADYLATSRPTAVNLFWALDRMRGVVPQSSVL